PMPLLKPSRLNHWGKLAFRWIYWHMMVKGRPLPFIPARMKMAGKKRPAAPAGSGGAATGDKLS
ncbi:MAG TPA: NAD(P)/FAD-dependent oxidoreductase, partial [Acidobacteriota bacterium]|nr:NAD(P)/FAD-dependent oxidoreductase [Acidobacteriota bacterium]